MTITGPTEGIPGVSYTLTATVEPLSTTLPITYEWAFGDSGTATNIEAVSTGSIGLDVALGIGGVPKGRVVEIYGPESSGKTTLTLQIIAEAQKTGGTAAFVDAEHALDPTYAEKLGVNVEELLVSQPDTGEQALEITDMLVRSGAVDVIVVDSVAALVPTAEIEGQRSALWHTQADGGTPCRTRSSSS